MTIRNILYHGFNGKAGDAVERAAVLLANDYDASLTALSVVDNTPIPTYVMPYVPVNMPESYIDEARADAQKVKARCTESERTSGRSIEWRYAEGNLRAIFTQHARYTDLCVLAQGAGDNVPVGPSLNLPSDLVLSTGRPILVVPWNWNGSHIGKLVVVAWDASREATRALHDSMSILERADAVKVITVGPEKTRHISGAETAQHLAHHGVKVEAEHIIERDRSTAEAICDAVKDFGADLLVSGAWGHSRMLQTIMGGVTRDLLHNPPAPLFLSH
jgi:nucleotide-binding universal stress UspA family protein